MNNALEALIGTIAFFAGLGALWLMCKASLSAIDNMKAPHVKNQIPKRGLRLGHSTSDLDFYPGEDGQLLPDHVRGYFKDREAGQVRPTDRGRVKRSGIRKNNGIGGPAKNLSGPPHTGIYTKQPLIRR